MSFRGRLDSLMAHLRRVVVPPADAASDASLLNRFVADGDQAAFELLLWRHGPMIMGVCRRMLRCHQDAEDAFQAAFLLLARKAASIRRRESVAGWLYTTACRVALRARVSARRQPIAAPLGVEPAAPDAEPDVVWRDLRPVLDEEIHRLPEQYRIAIVLCYFQRLTHAEAALQLGCPRGTVAARLHRARELLRRRLTRRGLALSAAALAVLAAERTATAAAPAAVVHTTLKAALLFAAGKAVGGAASAQAVAWTQGILRSLFMSKMKMLAATLLLLAAAGGGVGYLTTLKAAAPRPDAPAAPPAVPAPAPATTVHVPAQRDGILLVVGSEIKEGEKIPADRVVVVKIDGQEMHYRLLKEGDTVEEGQLLARLDDRLARLDVETAESKVDAAEASVKAAAKVREEAARREQSLSKLVGQGLASAEDIGTARVAVARAEGDEQVAAAAVQEAKTGVKTAQAVLGMYEIRSPVRGVVTRIGKSRGEAVKALETVVEIEERTKE